jgi:hypothetical protein
MPLRAARLPPSGDRARAGAALRGEGSPLNFLGLSRDGWRVSCDERSSESDPSNKRTGRLSTITALVGKNFT